MKKNKKLLLNIGLGVCVVLFLISAFKVFSERTPLQGVNAYHLKGPVKVEETKAGWRLTVGGSPFFVRGVCYQYTPIGKSGDYDLFSDSAKPWITDGALMKKMGVNAVRFYEPGKSKEHTKTVIRDLFRKFGIKTAMGHYLGFWEWPEPNYADTRFRDRIKNEVIEMVKTYKDEDGILFWILGNENNYSFDRGIRDWSTPEIDSLPSRLAQREAKAKIYYGFVNDIAKAIKEIDPDHPVVMGNGELVSIYIAKELCLDVDILGGIIYQGKTFGTYFKRLERNFGKPNVFIEFGADRYDSFKEEETQDWQAFFIKMQWIEIDDNREGAGGVGNSLGGFVFEWSDEWWKHNPEYEPAWKIHDKSGNWSNTAYYFDAKAINNMNEELWGIVGLAGNRRVPKKAYYVLRSLWTGGRSGYSFLYAVAAIILLILSIVLVVARKKVK